MEEFDYEKDLSIDPMELDEEWLRQPGLFMKYSEQAAEAEKRRNQAKERIDVIRAELDKAIRSKPEVYGLEKITETAVSSAIILRPEYKAAMDELTEAIFQLNILQSAVRAFDHKRAALENSVKLWLGSYFSGPKAPRDIPGGKRIIDMARDKISSQAREEVNRRMEVSAGAKEEPRRRRG